MTKAELLKLLAQVPDDTPICVRQRDDAYPAKARCFKDPERSPLGLVLYLMVPEGYLGAQEVALEG